MQEKKICTQKKNPTLNATDMASWPPEMKSFPPVPGWINWYEMGRSGANANVNVGAYIHTATCPPKVKAKSKSMRRAAFRSRSSDGALAGAVEEMDDGKRRYEQDRGDD